MSCLFACASSTTTLLRCQIKKILAIDGKTQRGNGNKNQKANHIVSAVDENGFCLGQKRVEEKSNEITAIPELLDDLNVRGHIIKLDAMGTQREIAKKIRKKRADYVLIWCRISYARDMRRIFW